MCCFTETVTSTMMTSSFQKKIKLQFIIVAKLDVLNTPKGLQKFFSIHQPAISQFWHTNGINSVSNKRKISYMFASVKCKSSEVKIKLPDPGEVESRNPSRTVAGNLRNKQLECKVLCHKPKGGNGRGLWAIKNQESREV